MRITSYLEYFILEPECGLMYKILSLEPGVLIVARICNSEVIQALNLNFAIAMTALALNCDSLRL